MASYCIRCRKVVTKRMHALQCDRCNSWQHRQCNTGITPDQYRGLVKGTLALVWRCRSCTEEKMDFDQNNSSLLPDLGVPTVLDVTASPIRGLNVTYIIRSDDVQDEPDDMTVDEPIDEQFKESDDMPLDVPVDMPVDVSVDVSADESARTMLEDKSFINGREFNQRTTPLDDSLQNTPLDDVVPDDEPLTFTVVEGGSIRGQLKLVGSDYHTYTRRNVKQGRVYWTCSVRNKTLKCPASVKQFGELFTPSCHGHQHPADPGALRKVTITTKVKEVARENVSRPARDIVKSTMKEMTTSEDFALPKPTLLARTANRHRQKHRSKEPSTLR